MAAANIPLVGYERVCSLCLCMMTPIPVVRPSQSTADNDLIRVLDSLGPDRARGTSGVEDKYKSGEDRQRKDVQSESGISVRIME